MWHAKPLQQFKGALFFLPRSLFARKILQLFVALLLGAPLAGCEAPPPETPTPPALVTCVAGTTLQCYCANEYYGVQQCAEDGAGYGPCDCADAPTEPPEPPSPPEPPPSGTPECDPPLALSASQSHALPLQLTSLLPTGGSGAYQFEFLENNSGGLLNPLTGSYLAGSSPNTSDQIQVTDSECLGAAALHIKVVSPMNVTPLTTRLNPGVSVQLAVSEGSGVYHFELKEDSTGATLTGAGLYTAGSTPGTDTVVVKDTSTAEEREATFTVSTGPTLTTGARHLMLPLGQSHRPEFHGGSGHVRVEVTLPGLTWDGTTLTGATAGTTTATLIDSYTGETAPFTLSVVPSLNALSVHSGEHVNFASAAGPGDLNGDGYPDALVGVAEANLNGHQSGGVFVYAGTSVGLDITPAQVLAGASRDNRFGTTLEVADLNGDGLSDLIVGAYRAHVHAAYGGAVYIYNGIPGGFFTETPSRTLAQEHGYSQYGISVTTCDFDGDGHLDLAVGARDAEDRSVDTQATNQGAVFIYRGSADGLVVTPSQILFGTRLSTEGEWVYAPRFDLGKSLTSGYLNEDSFCDLVAGAGAPLSSTGEDGAVLVFPGRGGGPLTLGGVEEVPSMAYRRTDGQSKSQLGHALDTADLNGDNLDELLIGEPFYNGASNNIGAFYIVPGGMTFTGPATAWTPMETLTPHFEGARSSDNEGWAVSTTDHNEDGVPDVMLSSLNGELPDSPSNTGTLRIFFGVSGGLPGSTPDVQLRGAKAGDRFGFAASAVGDLDSDGHPEYLTFAARHDEIGFDVGLPILQSSAPDAPPVPLGFPTVPSGHQFGRAVSFVKSPANDGSWYIAVGASAQDEPGGYNRGAVYLYPINGDGIPSLDATQVLNNYPNRANSDLFGYDVVGLGDFNGDGRADLAVVTYQNHRKNIRQDAERYIGPGGDWAQAPAACNNTEIKDPGSVSVFLGQPDGKFHPSPEFVLFGPEANQKLKVAATADVNGDGLSDVLFASTTWDNGEINRGGIGVLLGRSGAANPDHKAEVVCEADLLFFGGRNNDQLGVAIAGVGDLNGDGCDEFIATSRVSDVGGNNAGEVRLFRGFGGPGCPGPTTVTSLTSGVNRSKAGSAVAGGADLDGDDLPDVVIGGTDFESADGTDTGILWLLSGAYLNTLPPQSLQEARTAPLFHPFGPALADPKLRVEGIDLEERFGAALSLVPNLEPDGRAGVLVGHPGSWEQGYPDAGGASLYRFTLAGGGAPTGFGASPFLTLSGETTSWSSELGTEVAALAHPGGPLLAIGGLWGQGAGLDQGSTYVLSVPVVE